MHVSTARRPRRSPSPSLLLNADDLPRRAMPSALIDEWSRTSTAPSRHPELRDSTKDLVLEDFDALPDAPEDERVDLGQRRIDLTGQRQ